MGKACAEDWLAILQKTSLGVPAGLELRRIRCSLTIC